MSFYGNYSADNAFIETEPYHSLSYIDCQWFRFHNSNTNVLL